MALKPIFPASWPRHAPMHAWIQALLNPPRDNGPLGLQTAGLAFFTGGQHARHVNLDLSRGGLVQWGMGPGIAQESPRGWLAWSSSRRPMECQKLDRHERS